MFDICANLSHPAFAQDLPEVLARARLAGVSRLCATGTSVASTAQCRTIAKERPGIGFTAGTHPHAASGWDPDRDGPALDDALSDRLCLACGETGLDFDRMASPRDAQERCFGDHILAARIRSKPLFVHLRGEGAFEAGLAALDRHAADAGPALPRCVIHCFTGTADQARALDERGFWIGATGWICDPRRGGPARAAFAAFAPERTCCETDAPYLPPLNRPGSRRSERCESAFLPFVAAALDELRSLPPGTSARTCEEAAFALFGLDRDAFPPMGP